jgi:superfamily II DNA or RNA helicase
MNDLWQCCLYNIMGPATTSLSSTGYGILKSELTDEELKALRDELTVAPYIPKDYAVVKPKPYKVYRESVSKIYVPKCYGLQKYGIPSSDKLNSGHDIQVEFKGKLRPEQEAPVEAFLKAAKNPLERGGILNLPCAFGKTSLSIYILCKLAKKTLVIVHKDFLLQQWKERIMQFAPSARIGCIKAKVMDVEDKDIVIASLQSLSMKDYDSSIFQGFGGVIIDEVHHISAEVFCRALHKVNFAYAMGLSATIKRKDGLSKVFHWFLGDVVYAVKKRSDQVIVKVATFENDNPRYLHQPTMYNGKPNLSAMINNICDFKPRSEFIVDTLLAVLCDDKDRKTLILSDRRNHLHALKSLFDGRGIDCGYYYGGLKPEVLKESETKQVILATFQYASEGMDLPGLNTLILASPKSEITQVVGRILRDKPCDRAYIPLIIDIVDDFSIFPSQARKRAAYYKKCKYTIEDGHESGSEKEQEQVNMNTFAFAELE